MIIFVKNNQVANKMNILEYIGYFYGHIFTPLTIIGSIIALIYTFTTDWSKHKYKPLIDSPDDGFLWVMIPLFIILVIVYLMLISAVIYTYINLAK
jgi:hypothetical protein